MIRLRFQTRVVALMIVVVLAAQLATIAVVQVATERSVAARLGEELQVGQRVWDRFYQRRGDQLLDSAAVLADDFGFKAAVASGDPATMRSALDNHGGRIGAQVALLLKPDGAWLAGLDAASPDRHKAMQPLLLQARSEGYAVSVVEIDRQLYQVALIPVMAPNLIGWVGIGIAFGDAFADDFRGVTGLDASFVAADADGLHVFASSLQPDARAALETAGAGALARGGKARRVHLGQTDSFVLSQPLAGTGESAVTVLLQGSVDAAMAPFRALKNRILWLSGLAALVALLAAALLGRTVSRPIEQLLAAVRRVQAGDYSGTVAVRGGDEIADLASAFGRMQGKIGAREQRILHQANHDALTGLANRVQARQRLEQAIADRGSDGLPLAVLILDLDRFKEINDTLGHEFADQVLAQLGRRLEQGVRERDFVARLGGDEFMLLLDGVRSDDALERGNALLAHLRRPLDLPSTRINLDASIGIALFPQHGADAETLLRRADIALYDAKDRHGGVALYRPGRDEVHLRKLQLMGDLRQAIERRELSLRFQPKIDIASAHVAHVEALLRWNHASLGAISPEEFIPLAEHSGFIHEITRHVLDQALRCNAQWRRQGVDLGVAVNLSAMDLMDADLPVHVQDCLRTHGVPAGKLILELTESALMRDVEYAIRMLQRLRAIGVRLAIDDFGTGYSSLAQLKRMPVDELKIDKSFVVQLVAGSDDEVIVRSTIELGHNMGLSVIAEGVESDAALRLLQLYRCDMVQGYLFSPPLAEDEMLHWCRRDLAEARGTGTAIAGLAGAEACR